MPTVEVFSDVSNKPLQPVTFGGARAQSQLPCTSTVRLRRLLDSLLSRA